MIRIVVAILVASAPVFAAADETRPNAPPAQPALDAAAETAAVQGWGGKNPACAEWSDGCVVCTKAGCSTPGVACTPREIACRKP